MVASNQYRPSLATFSSVFGCSIFSSSLEEATFFFPSLSLKGIFSKLTLNRIPRIKFYFQEIGFPCYNTVYSSTGLNLILKIDNINYMFQTLKNYKKSMDRKVYLYPTLATWLLRRRLICGFLCILCRYSRKCSSCVLLSICGSPKHLKSLDFRKEQNVYSVTSIQALVERLESEDFTTSAPAAQGVAAAQ